MGGPRSLIKALRPHQWAKNVLVFVALIAAHQVFQLDSLLKCGLAFLAFSFTASAVYILNDLLDLESDRRHVKKRFRPFASGAASIPAGVALFVALLGAAAAASALLPPTFIGLLLVYVVLTTAYSVYLKRKLMVDVLCLASLYTLRILAGGAAASIVISPWLMAFSMFFFLSLAFAKRYTELTAAAGSAEKIPGRGYWAQDLELIRSLGPTSGYLCVLVFCLYLNSPDVSIHYNRPEFLWLSCPILLYWISRVWFLAYREQLDDDPVAFALHDRDQLPGRSRHGDHPGALGQKSVGAIRRGPEALVLKEPAALLLGGQPADLALAEPPVAVAGNDAVTPIARGQGADQEPAR